MPATPKPELWTNMAGGQNSDPFAVAEMAERLEAEGWDGGAVVDSECIAVEPYVTLTLCAQRTKRLKLATGVTNPVTRHPAVTAAAMATLQIVSGGRAHLGIGRGDSALAYIGASPMPIDRFEPVLAMIQAYLRGDNVPLEEAAALLSGAESGYEKLSLGKAPPASWLKWLPEGHQKVPMEVVATGPKAISIGARVAEKVSFVVGADVARIKWGMDIARQAAEQAGRDPATLKFGAWLLVRPHDDLNIARSLGAGGVAGMGRFQIMNKKVVGPVSDSQRRTLEKIAEVYDMKTHAVGGAQADALDPEFIDSFAIVGKASHCVERIQEIAALGLDSLSVGAALMTQEHGPESRAMVVEEILPALRR
jgi:5,10-methylenetetrahydromethanopterin reductase